MIVDNLASSIAATAFVAYLLSRCEPAVSATQYALRTSLSSLGGRVLGLVGALIVRDAGWSVLWMVTAATVVPALALLPWLPIADPRRPA